MSEKLKDMTILPDLSIAQSYNIADLPLFLNRERIQDFTNRKTVPHWNNGLEVLRVVSGCMHLTANGETHVLREGDICVLEPGCVHYMEGDIGNCEFDCMIAEESLFSAAYGIAARYTAPIFHATVPGMRMFRTDSEHNLPLRAELEFMTACAASHAFGYDLRITARLHSFLAILCTAVPDAMRLVPETCSKSETTVKSILSYIHANYMNPISTEDLCKFAYISKTQCYQLFRRFVGDTPANFLLKYRLHVSRNLLASTSQPISQIATACGFTHQSHFTNHFSAHFGITPFRYRKQQQK